VTYFAGVGPRITSGIEIAGYPPYVECDKCQARVFGETKRGHMAAWLRYDQAPRGWLRVRVLGTDKTPFFRRDYCKSCRPLVTR